jgi:hypothetical protein
LTSDAEAFLSTAVMCGTCPMGCCYGVDAAFMLFQVHGWGIHAV